MEDGVYDGYDDDGQTYDEGMYGHQQPTSMAADEAAGYQQDYDDQTWDAGPNDDYQDPGEPPSAPGPAGDLEGKDERLELYRSSVERWKGAFQQVASELGVSGVDQATGEPDVNGVLEALRGFKQQQEAAQEELAAARKTVSELQVQLAGGMLENIELRREAAAGWMAAEPSMVQLRQLILDPAVAREFERLRRDADERSRLVMKLKEDAEGLTFTQESKIGRALVAKCRTLQEENEELGRQVAAALQAGGGSGASETLVSLEREQTAAMQEQWAECVKHCAWLSESNEELNQQLLLAERELAEVRGTRAEGGGSGGGGMAGGHRGPSGGLGASAGGRGGGYGGRGGGYGGRGRGRSSRGGGGGSGPAAGGLGGGGRYAGHKRMR